MTEQLNTEQIKLLTQIEFYFNDFNLKRDKFLKEQLAGNNNVLPLETLLKFNKLKQPPQTVESLRNVIPYSTDLLELSEDGNGVRRKVPLENMEYNQAEIDSRSLFVRHFNPKYQEKENDFRQRIVKFFTDKYDSICEGKPTSFREELEVGFVPTLSITKPIVRVNLKHQNVNRIDLGFKSEFWIEFISAKVAEAIKADHEKDGYKYEAKNLKIKTRTEKEESDKRKTEDNKKVHINLNTVAKLRFRYNGLNAVQKEQIVKQIKNNLGKNIRDDILIVFRPESVDTVQVNDQTESSTVKDDPASVPYQCCYVFVDKCRNLLRIKSKLTNAVKINKEHAEGVADEAKQADQVSVEWVDLNEEELDTIRPLFEIPNHMNRRWYVEYGRKIKNEDEHKNGKGNKGKGGRKRSFDETPAVDSTSTEKIVKPEATAETETNNIKAIKPEEVNGADASDSVPETKKVKHETE